jgi:hypothetical protein
MHFSTPTMMPPEQSLLFKCNDLKSLSRHCKTACFLPAVNAAIPSKISLLISATITFSFSKLKSTKCLLFLVESVAKDTCCH